VRSSCRRRRRFDGSESGVSGITDGAARATAFCMAVSVSIRIVAGDSIVGAPLPPRPEHSMEYVQPLAMLIGVYLISLISPGPNFIVVTRTSMAVSRKAGLFAGLGLAFASLTWAVLAMVGVGLLIAHVQWLHTVLQLAGAGYLIWLGIKMIMGARQPLSMTVATELTWQGAMRRAYLVSMTSPKSLAFFGGIFALVIPAHAPLWFLLVVAALCFVLSAAWYCGVALCFSNRRVAEGFLRFKAPVERAMGSMLIVLGGLKAA